MNQQQFDSYRQNVWNQGAAIVDEHDAAGAGLTATALSSQISRLTALLEGFRAEYDRSRSPAGPVAASWIDPRFHDFYDFLLNILNGWKTAAGIPSAVTGGGGAGGVGNVVVPPIPVLPAGVKPVYRMILYTPSGDYGTSGTYFDGGIALCTPENPSGCNGRTFQTVADAVRWAVENDEIPVYIDQDYDAGVTEAWRLAAGGSPSPPRSFIVGEVQGNLVIPRAGIGGGSSITAALSSVPTVAWIGLGLLVAVSSIGGGRKP